MQETIHATLTIKDTVSPERRMEVAAWLREQAKALVKDGKNYSPQYRARYIVTK